MNKATIALALLLGAPLAAQSWELSLFAGQQQYPSPHIDVVPGTTVNLNLDSQTVFAVRVGLKAADLGPANLLFTFGLQPETQATVKGSVSGSPSVNVGEFKENHWSAGAMFNFKAAVAVGAGLEFRSEKLSGDFSGISDSTTSNRIWARLNAVYVFPGPGAKPFVGAEVAFPLSSAGSGLAVTASNAEVMKAMAPKSQFGLYGGIRF